MKVLQRIQKKANRKFHSRLFKEVDKNAEVLAVYQLLVDNEELPEWKRNYYRWLISQMDSGVQSVLDEEVAKEQDEFIDSLIQKAIEDGKLPKEYGEKKNSSES